jgi:diamine N-acetyltransferase
MKEDLIIRKISAAEVDVVVQLAHAIWPVTYKNILSEAQLAYMLRLLYHPSSLTEQMTEKHHQFLIAAFKNTPVAFASYSPLPEAGVYKLHKLYVHQQQQGKGIGKMMIDYITKNVEAAHGHALELNVNRNNKARWFYEKLGFTIIREEDIDIGNGYFMNDFVMRKSMKL